MNPWRCLIRLQFMTGEDGRLAFWKIAYAVLLVFFAIVLWHILALLDAAIARDDAVRDATALLTPLLWLFALFLLMSFGIKGAQLWAQTVRLRTDVSMRQTQEHRTVRIAADPSLFTDDERG